MLAGGYETLGACGPREALTDERREPAMLEFDDLNIRLHELVHVYRHHLRIGDTNG